MKRRELAVLVVVAVGSLLLALLDPWRETDKASRTSFLGEGDVVGTVAVELRSQDGFYEASKSAEDAWVCSSPQPGLADSDAVRRMLASARLLRSIRSAPRAPQHGIDNDASVVTLSFFGGLKRSLTIGALTANRRHQWVAMDSDASSYLVEAHLVAELLASITSLRSLRVIPWAIHSQQVLRVEDAQRWLERDANVVRWNTTAGEVQEIVADRGKLQSWLQALSKLMVEAEDCEAPPNLRIVQGNRSAQLSGELCVSSGPLAIVLSAWERPLDLARMRLFDTQRPLRDFSIRCESEVRQVHIAQVEQDALWGWWAALDTAPQRLAIDAPYEPLCTLGNEEWTIAIGKQGEDLVATSPHSGQRFVLRPEVEASLQNLSALFRNTLLIKEDAVFLRRLSISGAGATTSWERSGQADSWSKSGGSPAPLETALALSNLARTLATLQAVRFVQAPKTPKPSARTIESFFESAIEEGGKTYSLKLWGGPKACTVSIANGPHAHLLPQDCSVLWSVPSR